MKKITLAILTCITVSGSLFSQAVPEVLYYKFDGTGTSVPNLATSPPVGATTATIMGGITQGSTGLCNGALIGTGVASSTDYLNTGYTPNLTGSSWTISFWTKDFGSTTTLYYIFGDLGSNSFRCFTNGVAGTGNWILRGAGLTDVTITGGATAAPHVCTYVYDMAAANVKAYLDGVLVNTVAQGAVNLAGTGPLKVMGYSSNVGAPLNGLMDEFRLYNRALSASEVLALNSVYNTASITATGCNYYTSPSGNQIWTASGTYADTVVVAGGCDTIYNVALTINSTSTSTISVSACDTYTAPDGATYTASGVETAIIPNAAGCDSTITINLTIATPTSSTINPVACNTYTAPDGATYTTSGTQTAIIPNAAGCDSTITINLTITTPTSSTISPVACGTYTAPDGATYTASGTQTAIIPNAAGCDSIITINLTITTPTSSTISPVACGSYTAPDGATYTASGTQTAIIPNAAGCDSTITINLTITATTSSTISPVACGTYTAPDGATYTASGTQTAIIPNAAGCDSTITINLTINAATSSTISPVSCGAYTAPDGAVYTTAGTYTAVVPNAAGCDSTITINLTIDAVNTATTTSGLTITASSAGSSYQWINCATNLPIASATNQSYTATANGSYAVIVNDGTCSDTSSCVSIVTFGITEQTTPLVSVYPNPTSGKFTVVTTSVINTIEITDVVGRVIKQIKPTGTETLLDVSEETNGVYFVKLVSGTQISTIKIVKN